MLAAHLDYRPTVTDGGRHQNRRGKRWRFGKPFESPRWRIIAVEDGVIQWTCRGETVDLEPGSWGLQQPDSASEPLYISRHSRWCELRFSAMPGQQADPLAQELWGIELPRFLPADQAKPLQRALDDILAWWWRDPWHRVRADARLAGMLIDLAQNFTKPTSTILPRDDALTPADVIWATRPLAPIPELAEACGLSERQFRRTFAAKRGTTPSAFARRVMAAQACDLLRDRQDLSVEAIAQHLGYRHAPTFIRAFAAEVGQAPASWRTSR